MENKVNTTRHKNFEIITQRINEQWVFYIKEKGLFIYRGNINSEDEETKIIDYVKFKIDTEYLSLKD